MDFPSEQPKETAEVSLEALREEIRRLAEEQRQKRLAGENSNPNYDELDPDKLDLLTDEDLKIWRKIKDESITFEEFEAYREKLFQETKENTDAWEVRGAFQAVAADKVTFIAGMRQVKQLKTRNKETQ